MPSVIEVLGSGMDTVCPSSSISPASWGYTPARILTSVDLPAPLSPTSATTSPAAMSRSTSVRAFTDPKDLEIPLSRNTTWPGVWGGGPVGVLVDVPGVISGPRSVRPVAMRSPPAQSGGGRRDTGRTEGGPEMTPGTSTSTPTGPPPQTPGQVVLRLRGISKSFGSVKALTDVDLDIAAGEVVALVGDNGAGKSTLVKILAGVHPQDAGEIELDGHTVSIPDPSTSITLGIATVFQDLALCENLDVVSNLFLGREMSPRRLDEVSMEVRSWELLRQLSASLPTVRIPVSSLSGGQRQTVAIARSLLGKPKVTLLDEPTAALGVVQTAEVLDLIERLRENGEAVLMISHNLENVHAVADRVVVLRLGRNNGVFNIKDVSSRDVVEAITGASDNVVTRRAGRRSRNMLADSEEELDS